jgi:hypothetical protein
VQVHDGGAGRHAFGSGLPISSGRDGQRRLLRLADFGAGQRRR